MAMDLEIMYSDIDPGTGKYRRVRAPFIQAPTVVFDRVGILFMVFSAETTAALGRVQIGPKWYRRCNEVFGWDHYAITKIGSGSNASACLFGWDDGGFSWNIISDPFSASPPQIIGDPTWDDKINWPPWLPANSINFEGGLLLQADWVTATAEFNAGMH